MNGTITLPAQLLRGVGMIMEHRGASGRPMADLINEVRVAPFEHGGANEWIATFVASYGTVSYIVNERSGSYRVAGLGDRAEASTISADTTLRQIADVLSGEEWSAGTAPAIAEILNVAGYEIEEPS